MSSVFSALDQGYSPEEVIGYLAKAMPQMGSMIKKAKTAGYPAKQILGFLSKSFETEDREGMSESERHAVNRRADSERTKYGLKAAGTMIAAPLAAHAARGALARALPASLNFGGGQPPGSNNPSNPSGGNPLNIGSVPSQGIDQAGTQVLNSSSQPPSNQPSVTQPVAPSQPEVIPTNFSEIFSKYPGVQSKIHDMVRAKNDPEAISQYFKNFNASQTKKLEKETGKSIDEIVSEYVAGMPEDEKRIKNREEALGAYREHKLKQHDEESEIGTVEQQPAKMEKGSTVASPNGIGEIKEIRNGKAIVEVDGKKHQVNEDELESEPEEIRSLDLEGPVSDYLSRIPEGQKSSVIDVSLFDPTTNELQVRFPNGDQWVYGPVPEEIFEKINSMTGIPVSSGESKLRGTMWETGVENSAGADFYKLIKKFVKEGKIKERKLKTGIDLFKGFTRVKKRK